MRRLAITLAALLAFPAAATARSVEVPVLAYTSPASLPRVVPQLRLGIRVPDHAHLTHRQGLPVVTTIAGRCRIAVGLVGDASARVERGGHARRFAPVPVIDAAGVTHRARARLAGPATGDGQRQAVVSFTLPASILPAFPGRQITLGALQASAARHCAKGALDRALIAVLRAPRLQVVGTYAPDDPAPLTEVASLPHLTIGGQVANGQLGEAGGDAGPLTSVGDTDGDGHPELAIHDLRGDATDLVDLAALDGSVSIADPGLALRLLNVDGVEPAGDIDGDGRADLAVVTRTMKDRPGRGLIVLGRTAGATVDPSAAGTGYVEIHGPPDCPTVGALLAPGDIDGDGPADLVAITRCERGAVAWLVAGGRGPGTLTLGAGDGRSSVLTRARGELAAAPAGDVDGDGRRDVAIAVAERHSARIAVGPLVIRHRSCAAVVPAGFTGDVNGDGYADVLINATDDCPVPGAFVVFGGPAAGTVDLTTLVRDGRGIRLDTWAQPVGGDATGDGLADVLAMGDQDTYLVAGRREPGAIALRRLGAGGRTYRVPTGVSGEFVSSALGVPDIDGDGRRELAFAAPYNAFAGLDSAGTVLVLGSRAG